MAEVEDHFTVFIRLPFNRGDFIDPPPVSWSAAKERALWDVISRQSKGNEIDWKTLAEDFEVTQPFLLQQAAWLYERQLSQVRAQMRRVGGRPSATPSPVPGSTAGSMIGGQAMRRAGSGGSRVPSRLSTQALGSTVVGVSEGSVPGTPAKSKTSLPLRATSGVIASQVRGASGSSRPLSQQSSKDVEIPSHIQSRRGSVQYQLSRSPGQRGVQPQSSESEEEGTQSKMTARRPNPASLHRRALSLRKDEPTPKSPTNDQGQDSEDSDSSPSCLPFAAHTVSEITRHPGSPQDPSATIRGALTQAPSQRLNTHRRSVSERTNPQKTSEGATTMATHPPLASSTSSLSSNPPIGANPTTHPQRTPATISSNNNNNPGFRPNPLSPRQQAALASAAGLSPRHRARVEGSDTSPSMGSSFSDLDDTSVTQSALEEALMSGMGNTTATMGGTASVASRTVSGIGQALRSRYFETRTHNSNNGGNGDGGGPGQQRESER